MHDPGEELATMVAKHIMNEAGEYDARLIIPVRIHEEGVGA